MDQSGAVESEDIVDKVKKAITATGEFVHQFNPNQIDDFQQDFATSAVDDSDTEASHGSNSFDSSGINRSKRGRVGDDPGDDPRCEVAGVEVASPPFLIDEVLSMDTYTASNVASHDTVSQAVLSLSSFKAWLADCSALIQSRRRRRCVLLLLRWRGGAVAQPHAMERAPPAAASTFCELFSC